MVQGMTIRTFFSSENFSFDDAKQRLTNLINEWAKGKNVALIGDMTFSPPQDLDERTFLMSVYSDTEPYEPDPEIEI